MCSECGCDTISHAEMHRSGQSHHHMPERIAIERNVLEDNNRKAMYNRGFCSARKWLLLNIVSSPGSGKTTVLENTVAQLRDKTSMLVIEGDQQTDNDAQRIARTGTDAIQINTGNGCHLNAAMIRPLLEKSDLPTGSIILIENVGNLVCPALFDLGEAERIVVLSVTEGDDKPLKYPYIFANATVCLINKTDLLPYVPCDINAMKDNILHINPNLRIFETSALLGTGMETWCDYLLSTLQNL